MFPPSAVRQLSWNWTLSCFLTAGLSQKCPESGHFFFATRLGDVFHFNAFQVNTLIIKHLYRCAKHWQHRSLVCNMNLHSKSYYLIITYWLSILYKKWHAHCLVVNQLTMKINPDWSNRCAHLIQMEIFQSSTSLHKSHTKSGYALEVPVFRKANKATWSILSNFWNSTISRRALILQATCVLINAAAVRTLKLTALCTMKLIPKSWKAYWILFSKKHNPL